MQMEQCQSVLGIERTMYSKVLLVSAFVALVGANDIFETANNTEGHLVFHQRFEAQWAMTRQTKDVVFNSSDIITGINVTDLREHKDGEAKIVSGGLGHENVTISLSSPAVFRGFDFLVEIFSAGNQELDRGNRGLETEPQIPQEPQAEDKTGKPSTDKPVTVLPVVTGVPDAAGFPNVTQKPTVTTGKPTVAADNPVTGLPIGTGAPDAAGLPTVTPKPKVPISPIDKLTGANEEMDVPEEIEQEPSLMKQIGFHPPSTGKPHYQ